MGGSGSTRWHGYERKTAVEECLQLSIGELLRKGISSSELKQTRWLHPRTREPVAVMFYTLDAQDSNQLALWIRHARYVDGELQEVEQRIGLEATPCYFGGERWWMECPEPLSNRSCEERRCGKLYLPPGEVFFACRKCHELTYESCQRKTYARQMCWPIHV